MPRPKKKDARYMNFYLDNSIANRVDTYSEETGISKSRIVEDALDAYLNKKEKLEEMITQFEESL